jgi:hypothetical protein
MIGRAFGVLWPGAAVLAGAVALSATLVAADRNDPKKAGAAAGKDGPPARPAPRSPGVSGAIGARTTSIMGAAWHSDNSPIPFAKLRLRNVVSGRIHTHTAANEMGQFAFHGIEVGTYVVELVSESGRILTIGHAFTVAPGETVATFVRLGTRVPWFNGFFGNAAAAVAATAASTGITAIAPESMRCVSPPCGGSR